MTLDYSILLDNPLYGDTPLTKSAQKEKDEGDTKEREQKLLNELREDTLHKGKLTDSETFLQVFPEFSKFSCAIVALSSITGIPPHKISLAYHRIVRDSDDESLGNAYTLRKLVNTGIMRELYEALDIVSVHPGLSKPIFSDEQCTGIFDPQGIITVGEAIERMRIEVADYQESLYHLSFYNENKSFLHDVGFSNGYYVDQHQKIPTGFAQIAGRRIFSLNRVGQVSDVYDEIIQPISFSLNKVSVESLKQREALAKKELEKVSVREDRRAWLSNDLDYSMDDNSSIEDLSQQGQLTPEQQKKVEGTVLTGPVSKDPVNTEHLPKSTADIPSLEDLLSESFKSPNVPSVPRFSDYEPFTHEVAEDAKHITGSYLGHINSAYKTITWEPRSYQFEAFEKFCHAEYFALFFDMGTGKTKTAIDIAVYKYETKQIDFVLVLAPNMVHQQWCYQQFPEHCCIDYEYMIWSRRMSTNYEYQQRLNKFLTPVKGSSSEDEQPKMKVFFVNIESVQGKVYGSDARASLQNIFSKLSTVFKKFKPFIILDESSRIKNPNTNTSEIIRKMQAYGHRCILSGTPATKKPENVWAQYEFLLKSFFGPEVSYETFKSWYEIKKDPARKRRRKKVSVQDAVKIRIQVKRLLADNEKLQLLGIEVDEVNVYAQVAKDNGMSESDVQYLTNHEEFTDFKNLDQLKKVIAPCTLSVKKEDIGGELPPLIYTQLNVELTQEQKRMYLDMKGWGVAELEQDNPDTSAEAMGILAILRRCMQIVGGHFPVRNEVEGGWRTTPIFKNGRQNPKIRAMIEDINDNSIDYAIIWAVHTEEIIQIGRVLEEEGFSVGLLYGAVEEDARFQLVEKFLNKEIQFLVINPKVGSKGLNLQTCSISYFYSIDFNVENRLQARDRIHRLGQKAEKVIIRDVIATDSIDLKIHSKLVEGETLNDAITSSNFNKNIFNSSEMKNLLDKIS